MLKIKNSKWVLDPNTCGGCGKALQNMEVNHVLTGVYFHGHYRFCSWWCQQNYEFFPDSDWDYKPMRNIYTLGFLILILLMFWVGKPQ